MKLLEDENDDPGPRPVADSMEHVGRRLGRPSMVVVARLIARWEDVVGPAVAAHVTPVAVRDGVLVVQSELHKGLEDRRLAPVQEGGEKAREVVHRLHILLEDRHCQHFAVVWRFEDQGPEASFG